MARGVLLSGDGLADIDILEMRKLVSALETSAQGSSVLDLEVKCGLDPDLPAASGGVGLETEFLPETIEIILGEMVTPFTRSLDAALPGENIVFSMYSTNKNLWVSVHRDQAGREFVSMIATGPAPACSAATARCPASVVFPEPPLRDTTAIDRIYYPSTPFWPYPHTTQRSTTRNI